MANQINYNTVKFVASYGKASQIPPSTCPEVSFVGRSNVGKSSIMNKIFNRRNLVKVSSTPGKTANVNFFEADGVHFVDLPGYGFARVSRDEKARWQGMIEGYLSQSEDLKHALALVDIRHEPSADDQAMVEYMRHYGIEFTVVATKADKLSRAQVSRSVQAICRALQVQPWEVIPVSAQSRQGLDKMCDRIGNVLEQAENTADAVQQDELTDDFQDE